jgi:hypothetical protein
MSPPLCRLRRRPLFRSRNTPRNANFLAAITPEREWLGLTDAKMQLQILQMQVKFKNICGTDAAVF